MADDSDVDHFLAQYWQYSMVFTEKNRIVFIYSSFYVVRHFGFCLTDVLITQINEADDL